MSEEPPGAPNRMLLVMALVALALAATLATVLTSHYVFPRGTNNLDESAYQSQANAISAGHLTLPRATHDPFFRPFLSGVRGDRLVFKYQPEWPAFIAASDRAFGSSLPLRVLMSIAGVFAVAWLAWELLRDHRIALLAGALVVASPFVWVQTASILGYQPSFVFGTAASAALIRAARTRSILAGVAAGALLGIAVLHRPFDAVLAIAPVLVYALRHAWRSGALGRLVATIGAGAAPFAVGFLAYNQAALGSPLRMAYSVSGSLDRFGFGWRASFDVPNGGRGGQIHYTVGLAFQTTQHVFAVLPRFVAFAPAVLACFAIALWRFRTDGRMRLLVAMILTIIVGYFFWWGNANEFHFDLERSLGPFYEYPLLPPLFVAAAWGFFSLRSSNAKAALLLIGVVWAGASSVFVVRDAQVDGKLRDNELAAVDAPSNSLVLDPPLFPNDPYLRVADDANLRDRHLVAVDIPGRRFDVVGRFPDRATYRLRTFRTFNDALGAVHGDRVPVVVVRGASVTVSLHADAGGDRAATSYLRVGAKPPQFGPSGSGSINGSWPLTASTLGGMPAGIVEVAAGVTRAPPGAPAPTAMTGDWYECRFEARATAGGRIEALTPCDGWHHYGPVASPDASREDLSPALDVQITPG